MKWKYSKLTFAYEDDRHFIVFDDGLEIELKSKIDIPVSEHKTDCMSFESEWQPFDKLKVTIEN